jgi:hypothetical protein
VKRCKTSCFIKFSSASEKRKYEQKCSINNLAQLKNPETSQHPNHQLLLIKSPLTELSEQHNNAVPFTSHSANLVRETLLDPHDLFQMESI